MSAQQHSGRGCLSGLVLLALGIAAGAGLAIAHYTGHLAPLYHKLGMHALHDAAPSGSGGAAPAGGHGAHAGHGGGSSSQGGGEPSPLPGYTLVSITPERQQRIGVRTGPVVRDRLLMSLRAVGIVEPDQTRLARIHTRISGWVTKVHVNFVGQNVQKGDPLVELYSPDLLQAQMDYLTALDAWETQGRPEFQKRLMEHTQRRLELWNVPADEIQRMKKTRKASDTLQLRAPITGRVLRRNVQTGSYVQPAEDLYQIADLSVLWLQAKIYEYELPHIELGQPVHIAFPTQPGFRLEGKVSFIEPLLEETTRTTRVRVEIDNSKDQYKPGMYADLVIDHDMGQGLLVPESALLRTGERTLAFRVLEGRRFEPVEVTVGSRFNERVEVLKGLSEGDTIVTSAVFLIDAESRLKSATSAMAGHQHGSGSSGEKKPAAPASKKTEKKGAEHDHHQHKH
jgi:Cu(I)/Ag(I) efflux system membrane fusion protein